MDFSECFNLSSENIGLQIQITIIPSQDSENGTKVKITGGFQRTTTKKLPPIFSGNKHFWSLRKRLLESEKSQTMGSHIVLNEKEEQANKKLMKLKHREIEESIKDPFKFTPARHFVESRHDIEKSPVYKFITKIPKGASLSGHLFALLSDDLRSPAFTKNLYVCIKNKYDLRLKHFIVPDKTCDWRPIVDLLKYEWFKERLQSSFALISNNPHFFHLGKKKAVRTLKRMNKSISALTNLLPHIQKTLKRTIEKFYKDNVILVELRFSFRGASEFKNSTFPEKDMMKMLIPIIEEFKSAHKDFLGVKFIYAPYRHRNNAILMRSLAVAKMLVKTFPEYVVGMDFVGDEDRDRPLIDYVEPILTRCRCVNLYFHAGETKWYGTPSDLNIIDAVLLGTKRITHGYSLVKHPTVLEIVKREKIGIEVCPVANQVLDLVGDLRNHPGLYLMAQNYSVIIGNDIPGLYNANGLSYDWYVAFMAMTHKDADLKVLKQLAINSLLYSSLKKKEKHSALELWQNQWHKFIDDVINEQF